MRIELGIIDNITGILNQLPKLTNQYVKQEMTRFAIRFRKMFVKYHLSEHSSTSIAAKGRLSKGGNFRSWVEGTDTSNLDWFAKISRILRVHEEGRPIVAKNFPYLLLGRASVYLEKVHTAKFALKGSRLSRVTSVYIPPRIHFRAEFNNAKPDIRQRIQNAMARAAKVAQEKNIARVEKMVIG